MSPRWRREKRCKRGGRRLASLKRRSPVVPGGHLAGAPRQNQSLHAGRTVPDGSKPDVKRLHKIARWCSRTAMLGLRIWSLMPDDARDAIMTMTFLQ